MKNNAKRWIAVGLALVILLASSLTGFKKEKKEELSASYINKLSKQALVDEEVLRGTNAKEKIKVVDLSGVIQSGSNSDFVIKDLKAAAEDPAVRGVILSINSPGGSVYVSEQIAKEIKNLKEKNIPVYSVMKEMAASGGYYVSAPTDRIYASNETLTGSIGVIMQMYSLEGLFDKYGIKEQNITSGKMKDAGSQGRDLSAEEKKYFEDLVNSAYKRFVKIVADGRSMSEKDVIKIADGRVYDGAQALENGLVDKIGDLDSAIDDMTEENKLTDPLVVSTTSLGPSFMSFFQKAKDYRQGSSDLAIIKEFMEKNTLSPMYLYGGAYGK
ncbi:signal peptide peptidase SppA [uncultured Anaerococcus sp.]|uniref:signal peptide peptidase SppA n=1 Tax=uncultured Anaerococcus sp. TaxID=293428 RepID=UPI00261D331F|nr:signal peptide peptidase SppA [uncultured Anaerococcus sp.]